MKVTVLYCLMELTSLWFWSHTALACVLDHASSLSKLVASSWSVKKRGELIYNKYFFLVCPWLKRNLSYDQIWPFHVSYKNLFSASISKDLSFLFDCATCYESCSEFFFNIDLLCHVNQNALNSNLFNRDIELLALFVACLCHDIDHRGTTNSFQVSSVGISSKPVQTKCFWFVSVYFSFLFFRSVRTGFDSCCLVQLEGISFGGMSGETQLLKLMKNREFICFYLPYLPED